MLVDFKEELKLLHSSTQEKRQWNAQSVYKVPSWVKDVNKDAYRPYLVSFGPYHHGKEQVKGTEDHKMRAVDLFFQRCGEPIDRCIDRCIEALKEVEQQLKDSYEQLDPEWQETDRFLRLMIMDGCFILLILSAFFGKRIAHENDPIFGFRQLDNFLPYIKRDMLLIENQLPLLALQKLRAVQLQILNVPEETDVVGLLDGFFYIPDWKYRRKRFEDCLHILDVYKRSLTGTLCLRSLKGRRQHILNVSDVLMFNRSATDLHEAGVCFEDSDKISFENGNGVFRLPCFEVNDTTESTFLNLMAFERHHAHTDTLVTSYIILMGVLIKSSRDIGLLKSVGIIENDLISDDAVAEIFQGLSKYPSSHITGSNLDLLLQDVDAYYVMREERVKRKRKYRKWISNLRENYFKNPWTSISVAAAALLLALTTVQTIYTVLSFHSGNGKY